VRGDQDIDRRWQQIKDWLGANAPRAAELLMPADPRAPRPWGAGFVGSWFGEQGGANLDMRASVLFGYVPLSGVEALDAEQLVNELLPERLANWDILGDDAPPPLVPIAASGAGTLLVVDARNGSEFLTVKKLDPDDPTTLEEVLWSNADYLLDAVLEALHGRRAEPFGITPVVSDGYLGWTDPAPESDVTDQAWSWARLSERVGYNWLVQPRSDSVRLRVIGEGLDRLVGLTPEQFVAATAAKPEETATADLNVLLAACVDHAFTVRGLDPPRWTRGSRTYMQPAWVIVDFPSAEIRRLGSTPQVFLDHGIVFGP
jgi:hypothetical protein